MTSAPTNVFTDIAALSLYAFFAFFVMLVFWLNRESKREGYPLLTQRPNQKPIEGIPAVPPKKVFLIGEGHFQPAGDTPERDLTGLMEPADPFPGAPMIPLGDPMQDGVGAASYALRADVPDLTFDDRVPKIVPLRVATEFTVEESDPDPRGRDVYTLDHELAGKVVDLWVDRSEHLLRYIEIEATNGRRLVVPMCCVNFLEEGPVNLGAVTAAQLAAAPGIKNPDQITLREEDRVSGYFGGGYLHAEPLRSEPFA